MESSKVRRFLLLILAATCLLPGAKATKTGVEVTDYQFGSLSSPLEVYSGDSHVALVIDLTNAEDSKLETIRATLRLEKPFFKEYYDDGSLVKSRHPLSKTVKEIKAGKSARLRYDIGIEKNAYPGIYRLELKVVYVTDLITYDVFPLYLEVGRNSELAVEKVNISPEKPAPGDIIAIEVALKNTGSSQIKNIKSKLDLDSVVAMDSSKENPFAPLGSETLKYIGSLNGGEEVNFTYKVISDGKAEPRPYAINLQISYRTEEGNLSSETRKLGIPLYGRGSFEIQSLNIEPHFSLEKGVFEVGQRERVDIEFDVINVGNIPVKFVTVHLPEAAPLHAQKPRKYIGPIQPDDFAPISFKARVGGSQGVYEVPVEITYVDTYNQKHSVVKKIPLKVTSRGVKRAVGENEIGREGIFTRILKWLLGL